MAGIKSGQCHIPPEDRYSVVISSTGRTEYLVELFCSLERQNIKPAEVIVLLDRSTASEDCRRKLERITTSIPVDFYNLEAMNLPAKRNFGARIASNDFIMYSDDDDIWNSNKSSEMLAALKRGWRVACHNYGVFGSKEKKSCSRIGVKTKSIDMRSLLTGDNIYGGGSSIACLRSLVLAIPFDESLRSCEDLDWWIRVLLSGATIYYSGESLVSYRRHKTNMGKNSWLMGRTQGIIALRNLATGCILATGSLVMLLKSATRPLR